MVSHSRNQSFHQSSIQSSFHSCYSYISGSSTLLRLFINCRYCRYRLDASKFSLSFLPAGMYGVFWVCEDTRHQSYFECASQALLDIGLAGWRNLVACCTGSSRSQPLLNRLLDRGALSPGIYDFDQRLSIFM